MMLKSYAGESVATGRASHARNVKGDDPDKKGYPGPPGWGGGHEANNPIPHNISTMKLQPKLWNWNQMATKTLAKEFGFGTWNVRTMLRPGLIIEYHK